MSSPQERNVDDNWLKPGERPVGVAAQRIYVYKLEQWAIAARLVVDAALVYADSPAEPYDSTPEDALFDAIAAYRTSGYA